MKVSIRRKSPGGARVRNGVTSDVYMSKVSNSGRRLGISIRLSGKCMDVLRWRPGDLVLIDFSRAGNSGCLLLTRTEAQDEGLAISQLGNGKSAQIRGSLDPSDVAVLFPNGQAGYHGQLERSTSTEGSFLFHYELH